jgi:hypothetical protein
MIFYVGEDIDFVDGTFLKFFVFFELIYGDHFDRVLLLVVVIDCSVDLPIDSGSDLFVEHIVLYIFYHPFE